MDAMPGYYLIGMKSERKAGVCEDGSWGVMWGEPKIIPNTAALTLEECKWRLAAELPGDISKPAVKTYITTRRLPKGHVLFDGLVVRGNN